MPIYDALLLAPPAEVVSVPRPAAGKRPRVRVPERRLPWNIRQLGAHHAWEITRGEPGILVAIVDTGIDVHHPDLRGKTLTGVDVVSPGAGWVDDLGHGTAVAGVIGSRGWRIPGLAGVAPACRFASIKCNIHGTTHVRAEHIAAGIRAAMARKAAVINLSVGVVDGEEFLTAEAVDELADALRAALDAGIAVICAAGPGGTGPRPWPGSWSRDPHFPGLIAVGGSTPRRQLSACTPAGDFITVLAPADGVVSTRKGGDFGPFGGTSAAAPHVAGIAALLKAVRPEASPGEIKDWIVAAANGGIAHAAGALTLALR
ncbi:MAG: S8 family serine peptidase [Candidatus Sericytochromatia bacterium]|nr:S8 family serine peptidase [Candidatus Tanganyikabacteria bacterium]